MADPYWGYPVDRDPRSAFPGFLSSENSGLTSHGFSGSSELYGGASDHLQRDAIENRARSAFSGFPGASVRPFTPLEDPALARREAMLDVKPGMTDIEHSSSLRKDEGLPKEWPGILFVDGLPNDCTRREAAHLFRPFIGFKDIKVFHKEPRRSGDKARVLCFVEFTDAKCASTAMEALQDNEGFFLYADSLIGPSIDDHLSKITQRIESQEVQTSENKLNWMTMTRSSPLLFVLGL